MGNGIKLQKSRLVKFANTINHLQTQASHLVLIGDYNIDQWAENEPWLRPELRALQPILDRIMTNNSLTRINKLPTRHAPHCTSSLLDLILASDPTAIKRVLNIKTGLSDHDGIICNLTCTDVTAANIMPMIDNCKELQSIFSETNVDVIAERLNRGLNEIAKKLIVKKRIQHSKKTEDFDDPELRNMRRNIKQQSSIAHNTNDTEEHRLLKHLKNQYTKMEKKKKKSM